MPVGQHKQLKAADTKMPTHARILSQERLIREFIDSLQPSRLLYPRISFKQNRKIPNYLKTTNIYPETLTGVQNDNIV